MHPAPAGGVEDAWCLCIAGFAFLIMWFCSNAVCRVPIHSPHSGRCNAAVGLVVCCVVCPWLAPRLFDLQEVGQGRWKPEDKLKLFQHTKDTKVSTTGKQPMLHMVAISQSPVACYISMYVLFISCATAVVVEMTFCYGGELHEILHNDKRVLQQ